MVQKNGTQPFKIYNYDNLLRVETLQPLQTRQVVITAPRFTSGAISPGF
ncbi:MAG: hypothetical protein KAT34_16890 [Candidatus Aminicenantes bacterium]|nr:hypothetical protein [Candidatus Aminicenantes bacterium]